MFDEYKVSPQYYAVEQKERSLPAKDPISHEALMAVFTAAEILIVSEVQSDQEHAWTQLIESVNKARASVGLSKWDKRPFVLLPKRNYTKPGKKEKNEIREK